MSRHSISLLIGLALFTAGCKPKSEMHRTSIIPQPVELVVCNEHFELNAETCIVQHNHADTTIIPYAVNLWEQNLGYRLSNGKSEKAENKSIISLAINREYCETVGDEGYTLEIGNSKIEINANTRAGLLYGVQTLNQLIFNNPDGRIPSLKLTDFPRFRHRGMHLDVSRHFMPIDLIFKLMDYLAMHKMNVFHWHLVDDQGWRLEIRKYPKLTEVGAWRVDMEDRLWDDRPMEAASSVPATYGGFYTQDEVRAVVAYAAERNITVMPEIEMPAHVMSALAAYPEYSCTGENLGVPSGGVWPITHIYCAGNDNTFNFLEDVLTEVMELFPTKYIHIGGDEADKAEWKTCKKCQQRIKKEGLKDEHELQSYFIKRIEKFLSKHNRTLVGWDEILEGGLAQSAVVMSWRGEQGGIEAARMGNQVIMTPGSHCYFDHYQGDPALEPVAFGGLTTLKKVYNYEPIPSELTKEQGKLVLGAQANHWTEHIPNPKHLEYMAFPRLAALSEVLWSPREARKWASFSERMEQQYLRYKKSGINYSTSAFQVSVIPNLDEKKKKLSIELQSEAHNPEIRYTTDGSEPNIKSKVYRKPIPVIKSTTLKAAVFKDGAPLATTRTNHYNIHKAFACSIELEHPNSPQYDGQGEYALVNGVAGSSSYSDGNWKGFSGVDMIATIDLRKPQPITSISVDALQSAASWIFLPKSVSFEVSSDGKEYLLLETVENTVSPSKGGKFTQIFETKQSANNVRFVRVTAKSIGTCPKGHSGEGQPAWLFVSEIVVE